jgi:hypothetical protein
MQLSAFLESPVFSISLDPIIDFASICPAALFIDFVSTLYKEHVVVVVGKTANSTLANPAAGLARRWMNESVIPE